MDVLLNLKIYKQYMDNYAPLNKGSGAFLNLMKKQYLFLIDEYEKKEKNIKEKNEYTKKIVDKSTTKWIKEHKSAINEYMNLFLYSFELSDDAGAGLPKELKQQKEHACSLYYTRRP